MRLGIGARIVLTVASVLAAALAVIAGGSTTFEARIVAHEHPSPVALPSASRFAAWYRAHRSWSGLEAAIDAPAGGRDALIVVRDGAVLGGSPPAWIGSTAAVDAAGDVRVVRRSAAPGADRALDVRFEGVPSEAIVVNGALAGTVYLVPLPSSLPARPEDAPTAGFRRRFFSLFAVVAVAAIAVALAIAARIVRPIRALTHAARTASGADLPRVEVRSRDEIGDLAAAFNALGERLMRSEVARRGVVSDVAHELRTPLTNIRCALESFTDGIDEPSPEAIASILEDVSLLERLARDLNDSSVEGASEPPLVLRPVDLEREVRRAADGFRERAAARGTRLEVVVSGPLPPVNCDAERVRQVLQNLLENALRYGRAGGRVEIAIAAETGCLRVGVADDGDGFPASDEAAIFERFHRLDASRSRATGGSGLGLAIAKHVIDLHRGTIGADGGAGRGATVWFTLPV